MNALTRLYHGDNDIDFTRWWRRAMVLSAVLVVVSIGSFAVRGFDLGIDFRGGVSWQVKAPNATVEATRDLLRPLGFADAKIQTLGNGDLRVQASAEDDATRIQVRDVLAGFAGVDPSEVNVANVGASWGAQLTSSARNALIVFLLAVFAYLALRLEWKMALGAIVAVVHDVVISVGVYSVFQFEVTPPTVIAFLTILGFSIYDTVVVFDKVQENQARPALSTRVTYTELMSISMNQVLMRSINTSVVALLPVLSMLLVGALLLGAVTLEEFAIALGVGLLVGAYSSLFVAAPMVVLLKEREPRNVQLRNRLGAGPALSSMAMSANLVEAIHAGDADATGVPVAPGARTPSRPTAGTGGAAGAAAARQAAAPTTAYTGAIPPRPRKKGKKR